MRVINAVFLLLLAICVGAGFIFLALNERVRKWGAKQNWYWQLSRTKDDKETAEAVYMLGPLIFGIFVIGVAVAFFVMWLFS